MAKKVKVENTNGLVTKKIKIKKYVVSKKSVKILITILLVLLLPSVFLLINSYMKKVEYEKCFKLEKNTIVEYDSSCSKDVVIPKKINGKKVKIIGEGSFAEKGINSVVIPEGITKIKKDAFWRNNLTEVVIPNSVTTINANAFMSNKIKKVNFGENLSLIGAWSFDGNYIENLIISDSVKTINYEAFANNDLKTVVIGKNVEKIEYAAFGQYDWDIPFYLNDGGEQNQKLYKIINKSGRQFDWYDILAFDNEYNGPELWLETGSVKTKFGVINITK